MHPLFLIKRTIKGISNNDAWRLYKKILSLDISPEYIDEETIMYNAAVLGIIAA